MEEFTLLVSDPPHNEPDFAAAAPNFGLTAAEVRMKANYPIPEIWLAGTEAQKIDSSIESLRATGLSVTAVASDALAAIPDQTVVKSFAFSDSGLTMTLDESDVELPFDEAIVAVFCQPREAVGEESYRSVGSPLTSGLSARVSLAGLPGPSKRLSMAGLQETTARSPYLDIYASHDGKVIRYAVVQDESDFSGLGELQLARAVDNMVMFVAELGDCFKNAVVDRRLMDMQPRSRAMVTQRTAHTGVRKGFSFATSALSQLLESIDPDMKDMTQFELASRLAYLTKR